MPGGGRNPGGSHLKVAGGVARLGCHGVLIARNRSSTPCNMYAAAILSITSPRRLREASASISVRVTAAVDRRSS